MRIFLDIDLTWETIGGVIPWIKVIFEYLVFPAVKDASFYEEIQVNCEFMTTSFNGVDVKDQD